MKAGLQRKLATGANAVLVAAIVIVVTGLLVDVAGQYRWRWDASSQGAATLLPQTLAVLGRLEPSDEVVVTGFSAQKRNAEAWFRDRSVRDLLRELEYASPNVTTRFVDFDRDRLTAERLGVDRYGTIVVEGRGDRVDLIDRELFRSTGKGTDRALEFLGEGVITRALEQVLSDDARTVYTLYGHGEKRVFDRGIGELKELGTLLRNQGWTVRTLDLLRDRQGEAAPAVPTDAAAVVLLGPKAPLAPIEEEALRAFVGRGGSVGVFVDPAGVVPDLLAEIGVAYPQGVVLDAASIYPYEDRPLLQYRSHPITRDLVEAAIPTVVAHAGPLQIEPRDGVRVEELLTTSRRGWIERGTERPSVYTEGADVQGPITVAAALHLSQPHPMVSRPGGRVLVVGDADVLGNELLAEGAGNATFVTNAMRWLVRADDRMSRVGKAGRIRKLALTPGQLSMIRWLVIGLLPLLAVLGGGAVWAIRRSR